MLRANLLVDGVLDVPAWVAAYESGSLVGTCGRRNCMGALKVAPAPNGEAFEVHGEQYWLTTRCLRCGHEATAPGGKLRHRKPHGRRLPSRDFAAARAAVAELAAEARARDLAILGEGRDD